VSRAAAALAAEATAARRAASARTRKATIQADQARIAARQAERAQQGQAAAALPVPASAPRTMAPEAPGSAGR